MSNKVVELKKLNKEYYIYKNNFRRILGIIFGKRPSEIKHAVKNVSFSVEQGERIYIFGIVTSGVTTVQKMISGIVYPTSGKVITRGEINCLLERNAGFDVEMTCLDNVYMRANVIGVPKQVVDDNLEDIIKFAEIEPYKNIALKQASKGTPTRLSLAIHLLKESDIFIMDTPFSQGGTESRLKCEEKFRTYMDTHPEMTFITSNVNMTWAKNNCTRGIVMHKGEIIFDGPVDEAAVHYKASNTK